MTNDIHDLAAAYALDALEPHERRAFEATLTDDPALRDEVAGFRAAASELAAAVAEPPPSDLKAGILARIAETEQLEPLPDSNATTPRVTVAPGASAPVIDLTARRSIRRPSAPLLAVAAAASLIVVGLASALFTVSADRDRAREIATAIADPEAIVVDLEPTGDAAGSIRVIWQPGSDEPVILAEGLADPGAGSVYELWALGADAPVPAGLFEADGSTFGSIEMPVDPAGWAVTIEPEGGSPAPTSEILFLTTTV